jgi:hypothetical protein
MRVKSRVKGGRLLSRGKTETTRWDEYFDPTIHGTLRRSHNLAYRGEIACSLTLEMSLLVLTDNTGSRYIYKKWLSSQVLFGSLNFIRSLPPVGLHRIRLQKAEALTNAASQVEHMKAISQ